MRRGRGLDSRSCNEENFRGGLFTALFVGDKVMWVYREGERWGTKFNSSFEMS